MKYKIKIIVILIIIILFLSGCASNENKKNDYKVQFRQDDYIVVFSESFDINEGEELIIPISITQVNLYKVFIRLNALDNSGILDRTSDEFRFTIIPPQDTDCNFHPSNSYLETTYISITTNVIINDIPPDVTINAKDSSEANKTANEQYKTDHGTGTWNFCIEWIGDGPYNLDNGGHFQLEIWVYSYYIVNIEKK